uniref:VRR-NUC domain-containing protein n=1 Tax=viral metagenome TaxID=1070528 RepID=A0A6M3JJG7_9ZZZZ
MSTPLFASEREFGDSLADVAKSLGWKRRHTRPARTGRTYVNKHGEAKEVWDSPEQGDPGFPDEVFAKDGRVFLWELKMPGNKPTTAQTAWIEALGGPSETARVLYPQDYDWAVRMLAEGGA